MQLLKDTIMIRDGISVPQFSDDTSLSEHDDDAILLFYVATRFVAKNGYSLFRIFVLSPVVVHICRRFSSHTIQILK